MIHPLLAPDTHLLRLSQQARLRLPTILVRFYPLIVLIIALLVVFLAGLVGLPLIIPGVLFGPGTALGLMLLLLGGFGPIFLLIWLWLWLIERRQLWTTGMERQGAVQKYLVGIVVGLALFGGAVALLSLFGYTAVEPAGTQPEGGAALGAVLIVLVGWLVQGAAEEILTRGFLLPVISTRWGTLAGIMLSSLLFALLHLLNPNVSLIAMLNLFLFGVFMSLYALAEGGLWGVFAIHSIWNWAQGNLFGFEVSGQEAGVGTLLNLQEVGPDWFTGGLFGPEGGIVVTIVLLVGCIAVLVLHNRLKIED